ncbi:endothelin-converting enzyme homolog isoform X2 [Octopus sinensis]|uniref:Endothelin-converting enzyme homolog isoform X2 n=1 Tax=Octopus sinensis TaxID=2607531 RepID=A0A7E6F195_9MOLL|nr:endothelin-converting enzyme homolog isoform X2 [Octopus sinensis]
MTMDTKMGNKYAVSSDERAEDCYYIFTEDFKHALGWMFVQKYFMKNQRAAVKEVTTITNYIINAVRKLLQDNKWLGETSKRKSLEKIQQLVKIIGFNAKTMTAQNVNEFFQGMRITANNFFRNIIQIKSKSLKLSLTELREKPNRKGDDGDGIFSVNAWYDSEMNSITIPAGILRNPFFNIRSPMSLNFGGLGTILGHELMHAFDNDGTLYNAQGEYSPWLTTSAKASFERLSKELINQYSHFKIPGTSLHINGQLTLDENIADNGGIHVAYNAFLKWKSSQNVHYMLPGLPLSSDQLFFLTFAQNWCAHFSTIALRNQLRHDPHAPDMARVLLTLRNSKEFAAAYRCQSGSYMNPARKYQVW